jgi:hypothetical protein
MSVHISNMKFPQSQLAQENKNLIQEVDKLRGQNYFYRSHLKELEIHRQPDLDIRNRLKELDSINRDLNKVNNSVRGGNLDIKGNVRGLAVPEKDQM